MKKLLSLVLLSLCFQTVQAETVEMKPETSVEAVEVNEKIEDFAAEKEALKKFMQASSYAFEKEDYLDLDKIEEQEQFDVFKQEVEEKENLFKNEKETLKQAIQERLEQMFQELQRNTFVNEEALNEFYLSFEKEIDEKIEAASSFSRLQEVEENLLEALEDWEESEKIQSEENKKKAEEKYLALLQEKAAELEALQAFVSSEKELSKDDISALMKEAEEKLQEAMDEKQMETIIEDLMDNFDDDFDLNVLLEEFLADEDVQSLIDWGLINQDELEAYFFDILENYEDYLDLGMTLRELFERRMASLEAMRALYEQREVLPATGVSSPLFYALALVIVGFVLWYRSKRK